jgi:type IV pilus assembly protein PilO
MKKNNAALSTFIDKKFIPLASKIKVMVTLAILIVPAVIFYFVSFQPAKSKIETLAKKKQTISKEIKEVELKVADLKKFEKELEDAKVIFEETSVLLPKDKEIPKLLTDISALGRSAGLEFLTFKPQADVPKDFYAEIPIAINVRGPYHNIGFFFDQISKMERIVSVSNIKMSTPKKDANEMLLTSDCVLVTYRFTNVELPKDPKTQQNKQQNK